jgi:hypothetical protein
LKSKLTATVQIISLGFRGFCCRTGLLWVYENLFGNGTRLIHASCDRLEVTSSSSLSEFLLVPFRPVESSISRAALVCGSTLHCSLVCERPGQCYGRAVFIGDDLAIHSDPRSSPPHRQGDMVAPVRQRLLPTTLGSIDEHEYSGSATRSKHLLFRPCLSA